MPLQALNRNQFDICMQCQQAECYDTSAVTAYLNSPLVRTVLNVTKHWEECTPAVDAGFVADTA